MKEGAEEPLLFLYLIDENVGGHSRGLSVATIIVLPAVSKGMSLPMLGELLGPPPPQTTAQYAHVQNCILACHVLYLVLGIH